MARNAKDRFRVFTEAASARAKLVSERTRLHAHGMLDHFLSIVLSPWRFFKIFCFSLGLLVLGIAAVIAFHVHAFFNALPDVDRMTMADLQRRAETHVHRKLENKGKRYKWVRLKEVSREMLFAIVLSEDATFFEHGGFNVDAIIDSLAENLKERRPAFGGSTITQQVAKNLFLTPEKTFLRKLQEAILTVRLESRFPKNDLLEVYFNIAEFGPDLYGVNAAAHHFFKKTPAELNAAQGAFLALMLPSPRRHYFQIYENRNLSKVKRRRIDRLLRDMLYQEYITDRQYRQYIRWRYFDDPGIRVPAKSRSGGF